MLQPRFIQELSEANSILIAGAGGGFDVFCGLPLFFALKNQGKAVHLANLSFSFRHGDITGRRLGKNMVEVTARSRGNEYFFPEGYLAQWLSRKRMDTSIFCIQPSGVPDVLQCYELLRKELNFDAIVLVDGGIDSILRGDESRIGTPVEDMCSLAAVNQLAVKHKQLICLGYGAETDVCQVYALETIASLIRQKAFLGALALSGDMPEVKLFVEATEYVFMEMRGYESVICSSVLAALDGHFGDHHRTRRTVGSQLWINPLMFFYWAFEPAKVAQSVLYLDRILDAPTLADVSKIIKAFREETAVRAVPHFPKATN